MIYRLQLVLEVDTRQHDTRIINQQIVDVTPKTVEAVKVIPPRGPDKKPRKIRSDKGVSHHEKILAVRPQYQSFSFPG